VSFAAGRRVAATSTRRDGGDCGGRCWCTCVSLSVRPSVRSSLRWSLTLIARGSDRPRARSFLVLLLLFVKCAGLSLHDVASKTAPSSLLLFKCA